MNIRKVASSKQARAIVGDGDKSKRSAGDYYPTPDYATHALFTVEKFENVSTGEPACGGGHMSEVLKQYFTPELVVSSDLYDRGYGIPNQDFLQSTQCYGNIITNPPFNIAQEFATKALEVTDYKVALLLKTQFIHGKKRQSWLFNTCLRTIYAFEGRIGMKANEIDPKVAGMLDFCWFVWEHGYKGDVVVKPLKY